MTELADRYKFTTIAHHDRVLLGPLSSASVDAMLKKITLRPLKGSRAAVLDVGCGKGEILLRAMRQFNATGLGVDPNPSFVMAARMRGREAGPDLTVLLGTFDSAPVPRGAFDLVICIGATHAFGDYAPALEALVRLVRPGGWALVGTGYWRQPPDPAYLAVFGGREDEMTSLQTTLAAPKDSGWKVVAHHASTLVEWDEYEESYRDAVRHWLTARPDDPDATAMSERIEAWADAHTRWGRDTMGFVTMVLRR